MNHTIQRLAVCLMLLPLMVACAWSKGATSTPTPRPATSTRSVALQSSVSVAGRLLFVQDGNLYLYQGQNARQITKDGTTRDPTWSPDGSKIAFVRRDESYSDIYVLDVNGGLPTQVTFNRGQAEPWSRTFMHEVVWAAQPGWSVDGKRLIFLSQVRPPTTEDEDPRLFEFPLSIYSYRVNLIGQRQPTNDDLLVRANDADFQRPVWSPDGTGIAFVRVPRNDEPKRIMFFDPNAGDPASYSGIPDNAYDPAWSPDGRWLAFAATVEGHTDIWAIPSPARGGSAVRLTSSGAARAPAWSPDGKQLAFVQIGDTGSDLLVMPLNAAADSLAGGTPAALTDKGQIDANSGLSWGK